ncbi:MAG: hypothetical protein ABIA47_04530, partial [bacterium]
MTANTAVTSDQYRDLDRQLVEIKRQFSQHDGYPGDPEALEWALRMVAERRFIELGWGQQPSESVEIAAEVNRLVECMLRAGYHKATNGGKGMKGADYRALWIAPSVIEQVCELKELYRGRFDHLLL